MKNCDIIKTDDSGHYWGVFPRYPWLNFDYGIAPMKVNRLICTVTRSGKRVKPADLFANGTSSLIIIDRQISLGRGVQITWDSQYEGLKYRHYSAGDYFDTVSNPAFSTPYSSSSIQAILHNRVRAKLKDGSLQLPVDLIELGKTRVMLTSAILDSLKFARQLRSGRALGDFIRDLQDPRDRAARKLANRWLEFQYGWKPTMASIYDTTALLAKKISTGLDHYGKVKFRETGNQSELRTYNSIYVRRQTDYTTFGSASFRYRLSDPKLLQLQQAGFTNPLAVAWELIPFSFVLDWFVDIGGYLNRMDAALGIDSLYVNTLTGYKYIQNAHFEPRNNPATYDRGGSNTTGIRVYTYIERQSTARKLSNTFTGFRPFTNEKVRLTSALALAYQQFLRFKR